MEKKNIALAGTTQSSPAVTDEMVNDLLNKGLTDFMDLAKVIVKNSMREALLEFKEEQDASNPYMGRKDVCRLLGISLTTLYRLTLMHKFETVKIGKRLMYTKDSVHSFIAKNENVKL